MTPSQWKIWNRVDCKRSEKRSKTHQRLTELFLIRRNRTKRENFRGNPLFQATYNDTSTLSSMTINVCSVLWDGWQSLVILRNVKVIPTMIFLQLCFGLRSTENLRTVPRLRLSASSSVWLKYETSNSNHLKNPTSHLTNPLFWSTYKRVIILS